MRAFVGAQTKSEGKGPSKAKTARRVATEGKLLTAVEHLIERGGVEALGVNAVAADAGVDKVLIYRYFGGLEGLLRAYAESADFWPSVDEMLGPSRVALQHAASDPGRAAASLFRNYVAALRKRPITLELLAWECVRRSPLTAVLEEVRERRSEEVFREIASAGFPLTDASAALASLLAGGLNYLCVRSRHIKVFGGIELDDDNAWDALFSGIERAFGSVPTATDGATSDEA